MMMFLISGSCILASLGASFFAKKIKVPSQRKKVVVVVTLILTYVFIVLFVALYGYYLDWKLDSFDTNGDGFFALDEQSTAQQEAMDLVINDAGRSLIFITAFLYAIIYTGLTIVFITIKNLLLKYFCHKNNS
jgi:hypothetical protein